MENHSVMRPEYPRPQFVRARWQSLNGPWQFTAAYRGDDPAGLQAPEAPPLRTIQVPFCPESELSGIGETDFMTTVWYTRRFTVPADWRTGRILLHFGAVDYRATVYVNGREAGRHCGGYASFALDITDALSADPAAENELTVRADDDVRSDRQARGKQCPHPTSRGCEYTRTTGIWQSVWLEAVPRAYLGRVKVDTDYRTGTVVFSAVSAGDDPEGLTFRVTVSDGERTVAAAAQPMSSTVTVALTVPDVRLWCPEDPFLYPVTYELTAADGTLVDRVESYVGVRSVETKNGRMYLNGRPLFQRLVLDQGFYPDGIYTAPNDAALVRDITLSQELGFNGARLHEKIFEERFLYHADRLGYLVWEEHGNWGMSRTDPSVLLPFLGEWLEAMERDYNHPAIIGWCPFNECNDGDRAIPCPEVLRLTYQATKALDPQRPVIDVSGFFHVYPTDLYDTHDYEQDVDTFRQKYAAMAAGGAVVDPHWYGQRYRGGPLFVSEYGGARYSVRPEGEAWGYGDAPEDEAAFADRYVGLTETLLQNERICAFCYTQLYDVEQEQNGLYTYARSPKFSPETYARIRACNTQPAATEKANT